MYESGGLYKTLYLQADSPPSFDNRIQEAFFPLYGRRQCLRQVLPARDRKGAFQTPSFPIPANSTRSVPSSRNTLEQNSHSHSEKFLWHILGKRRSGILGEERGGGAGRRRELFPRKDGRSPFLFLRDNTDKLERTKVVPTTFLPSYNLLQRLGPPIEVRGGGGGGIQQAIK